MLRDGLERGTECAYLPLMVNSVDEHEIPAGWLESLAISEAQLAAGQTVPAEAVRQRILDSIARLEAGQSSAPKRVATSSR
jgi:hypothetical protein